MFEKIIGNEKNKTILKKALELNKTSHSYLFWGTEGIGKKKIALEFAKKLLCLTPNEENCRCKACIEFDSNNNPDFMMIEPQDGKVKIDQIREMQRKVAEKPIVSDNKVYIIDDSDTMTSEAQNCLLKTLEEPPEYAVIILIVSNESRILPTIKSRCVIIKFQPLTSKEIKQVKPELSDDLIQLLEGSLLNAENIEQKKEQYAQLSNLVNVLENKQLVEVFNSADLLYKGKDDIITLLEYLNLIFFSRNEINAIPIIEKTKKKILANNNYDMTIDYCLMNIWDELHS